MEPDLELVEISQDEAFTIWTHGYPYRTIRWHFHPEYELLYILETSGRCFVGDYIGCFQPGQLALVGPNLPHNWVSAMLPDVPVTKRSIVLQFGHEFISSCLSILPDLRHVASLLEDAKRGIVFSPEVAEAAKPLMLEMLQSQGGKRIGLFFQLIDCIAAAGRRTLLASADYQADTRTYMSTAMNRVLAFLRENLAEDLKEEEIARLNGQSPSAFSQFFRRHTGMTFTQCANRMRINWACHLLLTSSMSVSEICYEVGFNNISNFNRHFLAQKNMTPSKFRRAQSPVPEPAPGTATPIPWNAAGNLEQRRLDSARP